MDKENLPSNAVQAFPDDGHINEDSGDDVENDDNGEPFDHEIPAVITQYPEKPRSFGDYGSDDEYDTPIDEVVTKIHQHIHSLRNIDLL